MASPGYSPPPLAVVASGAAATSTFADLVVESVTWLESVNKTDSRPYCLLSASTAVALTAATHTAISFDTEAADVGNGHVNPSATYTIPTAGVWQVSALANFASNVTTNAVVARITQNGTVVAFDTRLGTGNEQMIPLTVLLVCAAGDTIQMTQFTTASGNTSVTTAKPSLFCYWLNS